MVHFFCGVLEPLLQEVESLNGRIKEYDRRVGKMAKETYSETALLKQVPILAVLLVRWSMVGYHEHGFALFVTPE